MKKVRALIAVVLLAVLLYSVGLNDLMTVFKSIDLGYLTLLLLLAFVLVWASCLKWRLFIRASGNDAPMLHLMKLYTVGYFFNTLAPSVVAGDVARSLHLGKYLSNHRDAFISTFLERFTGLLAMSMMSVVFLAFGVEATTGLTLAILSLGVISGALALLCFSETVAKIGFPLMEKTVSAVAPAKLEARALKLIAQVNQGMAYARTSPALFINAMLLSLFFHALTILNTYLAARSVGWEDPDIAGLFVVVPLVLIVSMAPITPNGLGIQEGAFLFFLQSIGGTQVQGLGVGLILRAKAVLLAIVGGLLWMTIREPKVAATAADPAHVKCANEL